MHVCGRPNQEVERSPAWLPAATDDGCREPSPFARDGSTDRQRVEGRLDDAEPSRAARSLVFLAGNENAEVQRGDRGGADPAFEIAWALGADEDRGVEGDAHLFDEGVGDLAGEAGEIGVERLRRGRAPDLLP